MTHASLLTGQDLTTGAHLAIETHNGCIRRISAAAGSADAYIAPGLVDIQVNGYAGYDFNTAPLPDDLVAAVTRRLWQTGVTNYLPTVITNRPETIDNILAAIARACDANPLVNASIAGIHLEGPFISPEDGPRGAHAKEFVREPDWNLLERWQSASGGRIKIVTLSPEWPEALDFIRKCARSGITAAIGHTAATPEEISQAVAAGARLSTHLGNGAHVTLPRHPNYIWQQLAEDDLAISMIADGFHLPDSVLKVFSTVKREKALLISDSSYLAGMPPGEYHTHIGGDVVLTAAGKLHLAASPALLAGSARPLLQGVWHMTDKGLATLSDAWQLASTRPAGLLNLAAANGLTADAPANIVRFRLEADAIFILATYLQGQLVYNATSERSE
jgi:N-acetylglucosamine-6-phosphate deacetylase